MSDWEKVEENGETYWINEECGNIMKVSNVYVSFYPKIIKLGPFKTLEQAKDSLECKAHEVDKYIEDFNIKLIENLNHDKV